MAKKPVKPTKPRKPPPNRVRPNAIRVMATDKEKQVLEKAAKKARKPTTRYLLELALAKLTEGMAELQKKKKENE